MTIDLDTIVVLALAAGAVCLAHKKPDLGGALLVGIAVVTLLVLLLGNGQEQNGGYEACTPKAGQSLPPGCPSPAGDHPSNHTTPPPTPPA
ncbi:hypothetical protein [Streptomyces sp. NPDC088935]|uniref:hypothetical protein n=1 Tax=Streptomyces sp. NPDC088935 TaxID=3365916 RepID=UPI00381B5485